jgi:hypothetical protein
MLMLPLVAGCRFETISCLLKLVAALFQDCFVAFRPSVRQRTSRQPRLSLHSGADRVGRAGGSLGVQFPKQWLLRPISIAAASCLRVTVGFDKTAETASHFVGAFRRSPAHPVNISANRRIMILIRAIYTC